MTGTVPALDLYHYTLRLMDARRFPEAIDALTLLSQERPAIGAVHRALAQSCEAQGMYLAAKDAYRAATLAHARDEQQPDSARAWFGLGNCLFRLGRSDDGSEAWSHGLTMSCDSPAAVFQRSQVRLALGDYAEGWKDYEARKSLPGYNESVRARVGDMVLPPEWDGKSPGRVLCVGTMGAGDVIQFSRYLPLVAERCGWIMPRLACGDPLAPWLGYQAGGSLQWSVALDSLPLVLNEALPAPPPPRKWKKPTHAKPTVGVCWKGSPHHLNDHDRSSPISFLDAFQDPRWSVVSLQQGEGAHFPSYQATADAISQCDVVVTVDTSTAHVAGTLGVPTIVLPPTAPEYRWLAKGDSSPWYPSIRLVRRQKWDAWPEAIGRAKRLVEEML